MKSDRRLVILLEILKSSVDRHPPDLPVTSGVSRFDVRGLLGFLIYINSMPDCVVKSELGLFDQQIKKYADSLSLQCVVDRLWACGHSWHMNFKVSKGEHLQVYRPSFGTEYVPLYTKCTV